MTPRKKPRQARCVICNKFLDPDCSKYVYEYVTFDDIDNKTKSFIHKGCFFDLDFPQKQNIVKSMAIYGTIPMEVMYVGMKEMYYKMQSENKKNLYDLTNANRRVKELEFLVGWHKYPDKDPITTYGDTFWVTVIGLDCAQRDVFANGKWTYYDNIIAWAFYLYPSRFNETCYPDLLTLYKEIT